MKIGRAAVADMSPGVGFVVEVGRLVVRHKSGPPTPIRMVATIRRWKKRFLAQVQGGRESVETVVVVVQCQAGLLEVIEAFDAIGRLAGLLNRRQEQGNQDS